MTEDTKLRIEALPNCRVRLSISGPANIPEFEFQSSRGSLIAAQILNAARDSYADSRKPLPDFTRNPAVWVVLQASAWGLAPSQFANHESLTIQFGDAILALPIERSKLRQLGEAMLALSANSEHRH
jgi:hypothetical protein